MGSLVFVDVCGTAKGLIPSPREYQTGAGSDNLPSHTTHMVRPVRNARIGPV